MNSFVPVVRLLGMLALAAALSGCAETIEMQPVPASTKRAAPASTGRADPVQARLKEQCLQESGDVLRVIEKLDKQCDCFAATIAKSMSKEDREFYTTYNEVPTLNAARPEEVKRQCGMTVISTRGKLPAPEGH